MSFSFLYLFVMVTELSVFMLVAVLFVFFLFFFSSRRRHTRCALVTGVQTCALPISVWIHRRIVETFRLQEDLMLAAIGKTHHLVLDRGTVARADGLNLARVQRRPVEVLPDQSVACRRGLRDMATELRLRDGAGQGGERFRRLVSRLLHQRSEE